MAGRNARSAIGAGIATRGCLADTAAAQERPAPDDETRGLGERALRNSSQ